MIFDFCMVFLKGSKYLIFGSEIFSLWSPCRLTRKQAGLEVSPLAQYNDLFQVSPRPGAPFLGRPGSLLPVACKAGRDPALPGLQSRLCYSPTRCPGTPGLLSVPGIVQHLPAPQDSAGALPLFVNTHTRVHRAACTHACAHTLVLDSVLFRDAVPEREPQSRLLGSL